MRYGLLGERLGHSYSKIIHEKLATYQYDLIPLSLDDFHTFMRKRDFSAVNVTIPYKQEVIPYLDFIDETARDIGAVNTVVNDKSRLSGYNTDAYGFEYMLQYHNIDVSGKSCFILGDGGTAKTVRYCLTKLGAKSIQIVSRTKKENVITYEELKSNYPDAEVLVNTTPVGMYPNIDASPLDLSDFHKLSAVVDIIYNPLKTMLIKQAEELKIPAASGLLMLVAQAAKAIGYFIGKTISEEEILAVYQELMQYFT